MNQEYINFKNVTKSYNRTVALNNVSLSLYPGNIIGLLGPNGSGKTTFIKTLLRIIRQQSGSITVCGEEACYDTRKYISFMPDCDFLYDSMYVKDAVKYYKDIFKDFDEVLFYEIAKKLDLDVTKKISKLSKGNQEKVVLGLTFSRKVPIYILDEPFGSLDPLIKHKMLEIIKSTVKPNNLILISTHLIKDVDEILNHIVFLKKGSISMYTSRDNIISTGRTLEQYYLEVFAND